MKLKDMFRPSSKKASSSTKKKASAKTMQQGNSELPQAKLPPELVDRVVDYAVEQGRAEKDFRPVLALRGVNAGTRAVVDHNRSYLQELPQAELDQATRSIRSFLFPNGAQKNHAKNLSPASRRLLSSLETLVFPEYDPQSFRDLPKAIKNQLTKRLAQIFEASPNLKHLNLQAFGCFSRAALLDTLNDERYELTPLFPSHLLMQLESIQLPSGKYATGDEFDVFFQMVGDCYATGMSEGKLPLESVALKDPEHDYVLGSTPFYMSLGQKLQASTHLKSLTFTGSVENPFRLDHMLDGLRGLVYFDCTGSHAHTGLLIKLVQTNGETLQSICFSQNTLDYNDPLFGPLLKDCPRLTDFNVSHTPINLAWLDAAGVTRSKSLRTLNIADTLLTEGEIVALAKSMPALEKLVIAPKNSLSAKAKETLADLPVQVEEIRAQIFPA